MTVKDKSMEVFTELDKNVYLNFLKEEEIEEIITKLKSKLNENKKVYKNRILENMNSDVNHREYSEIIGNLVMLIFYNGGMKGVQEFISEIVFEQWDKCIEQILIYEEERN